MTLNEYSLDQLTCGWMWFVKVITRWEIFCLDTRAVNIIISTKQKKKPCYVRFIDACMTRAAKTNAIIPVKNLELIFLVDGLERE